jgi:hypothetical protein
VDGVLVDHDAHVDREKDGPFPVAEYSGVSHAPHAGQCWSVGELEMMIRGAGFIDIREIPTAADRSAIVAKKSA